MRDPVKAMRTAATVRLDDAEAFLRAVSPPGKAPDLRRLGEDAARLYVVGCLAVTLERMREIRGR